MPCGSHRRGLVIHQDVDHAVARLHVGGADLLRAEHPEPAALDHSGAAHADVAVARRDDHVAAAEQRCIAREATAGDDAHNGHLAAQPGERREARDVEAGHDRAVGVSRPAATAFGEQHQRELLLQRDAEQPVGLGVVAHALRTREHGCVVGHQGAARHLGAEQRAVDGADAGDEAVGRRVRDQVIDGAAAGLGRVRERAVLGEAVRIDEVCDVLARAAQSEGVPLGHRLGPRRVMRQRVAVERLLEVGAQGRFVGGGNRLLHERVVAVARGSELHQQIAFRDRRARLGQHCEHFTRGHGADLVLHLHRLEDEQHLPRPHRLAGGDQHGDDGAGHRCMDPAHRA